MQAKQDLGSFSVSHGGRQAIRLQQRSNLGLVLRKVVKIHDQGRIAVVVAFVGAVH